jgi:DNA-binding MarR family transcriptional regulator
LEPSASTAQIAGELRTVISLLVRRLRRQDGMTLPLLMALGRLERDGVQSVADMARSERVRPQSMAQTVEQLERDGLVAREPDPDDGRRALVRITHAGDDALLAERRRRDAWLVGMIERELSDEERGLLAAALPLLERLCADSEAD